MKMIPNKKCYTHQSIEIFNKKKLSNNNEKNAINVFLGD